MLAKHIDPNPARTAVANDAVSRALDAQRRLGAELRRNGNGKQLARAISNAPAPEVPCHCAADDIAGSG